MKVPHRFIVIDDDPLNNLICKYMISRFNSGADIQFFTDPEQALAMIEEEFGKTVESLDTVLFLDINMPSMNGWEFLESFKNLTEWIHKQITIYILSSSIDSYDIDKAKINSFIKGYLPKPLGIDTMNQIFGDQEGSNV